MSITHHQAPPYSQPGPQSSRILLNSHQEKLPKSQPHTIPLTIGSVARQPQPVSINRQPQPVNMSRQPQPTSDPNTHVIKADFVVGEDYHRPCENYSQPIEVKAGYAQPVGVKAEYAQPIQDKGMNSVHHEGLHEKNERLSPPKVLPGSTCKCI